LDKHGSQLFRYFGTTKAKFGILTNGILYNFYTDLEEPNKMDEKPFIEINLLDIKEGLIPELKKSHKTTLEYHHKRDKHGNELFFVALFKMSSYK